MVRYLKIFCKSTHFHGFYELHKSHSKFGKIIWLIAAIGSLSITGYLVYNAANEFLDEPVRIAIKHVEPDAVVYPPMKFCFLHWISWVNWSKSEDLNFTKQELIYAMSYLTDVYSSEYFEVEQIEANFKDKLKFHNMTLKKFYLTIAKNTNVFYKIQNRNYSIEFVALNSPDFQNIFHTYNTICYKFSEDAVLDVINEAKRLGVKDPLQPGHRVEIDMNALVSDDHEKFLTKDEHMKINNYMEERFHRPTFPPEYFLEIIFFPDANSPNFNYMSYTYSAYMLEMEMSVYSKKSFSINNKGQCQEGKAEYSINFSFLEKCLDECRAAIFRENEAEEDWIGFQNDIRPKNFNFLDENGTTNENLTYTRHHKLESWLDDPEKSIEAHHIMNKVKVNLSSSLAMKGCDIWDIHFNNEETNDNSETSVPIIYPEAEQIVMLKEVDLQTWSNFFGNIGGVLGIWTGASIITLFQIVHLCFSCNRKMKQPNLFSNK